MSTPEPPPPSSFGAAPECPKVCHVSLEECITYLTTILVFDVPIFQSIPPFLASLLSIPNRTFDELPQLF